MIYSKKPTCASRINDIVVGVHLQLNDILVSVKHYFLFESQTCTTQYISREKKINVISCSIYLLIITAQSDAVIVQFDFQLSNNDSFFGSNNCFDKSERVYRLINLLSSGWY